jgi:hypothetical protein
MGFIRRQEEQLAGRLLVWHYQRSKTVVPEARELNRLTVKLVDDAHRIAKDRGKNVLSIIKDLVKDLKK